MLLKIVVFATALTCLFAFTGCQNAQPAPSDFSLIFKYGIGAGNVLNTFNGTYTKDMLGDPSVATNLTLTKDELNQIYDKMVEIDYFNYPDTFKVVPLLGLGGIVTPSSSYYFKVQVGLKTKELERLYHLPEFAG